MKTKVKCSIILVMVFCSYLLANAQGDTFDESFSYKHTILRANAKLFPDKERKDIPLEIRGKVSDRLGPVPGVFIRLKGTTDYALTDHEGRFSIVVPPKNAVLIFTMVGLVTQEIMVGDQPFINVFMIDDESYLIPNKKMTP